jgi:hypothetical protein
MRKVSTLWATAAVPALSAGFGFAQAVERTEATVRSHPRHVDGRTQKAIDLGLKWLADNQGADGAWKGRSNAYGAEFPVAMTGLAGLAFLAGGSTPTTGPYAANVQRALHYLLRAEVPGHEGMITSLSEASNRSMYGHGFAMLFLAEVYGMEEDENLAAKIRKRLEEGVKLTAKGQSPRGGWYYTPAMGQAGQDEGSVTVTAVQALRAAKNAGIAVDKSIIERGIKYIISCQSPIDGGIRYSYSHERGESRPAITAAAVATLYNAGAYEKADRELTGFDREGVRAMRRCLNYCDNVFEHRVDPPMVQGFMFYTHLYLSQAMWSSGDKYWDKYYPRIRDWLLDSARAGLKSDGSWEGDSPGPGPVYGTSVALIVLQIPHQYLPILQR